jgi:hypothetical protein
MSKRASWLHGEVTTIVLLMLCTVVSGCFTTQRDKTIRQDPFPVLSQDESTTRFGDPEDNVVIELRRAKTSRPVQDLAIQYGALFPGGEVIRPGDTEEYETIDGRNAYKVVFKTKYIRKRKQIRTDDKGSPKDVSPDWKSVTMSDTETGKPVSVLYGPIIPRERILYLVAGDSEVYAIFMRADGDAIGPAKKRLEKFVREEIKYQ